MDQIPIVREKLTLTEYRWMLSGFPRPTLIQIAQFVDRFHETAPPASSPTALLHFFDGGAADVWLLDALMREHAENLQRRSLTELFRSYQGKPFGTLRMRVFADVEGNEPLIRQNLRILSLPDQVLKAGRVEATDSAYRTHSVQAFLRVRSLIWQDGPTEFQAVLPVPENPPPRMNASYH